MVLISVGDAIMNCSRSVLLSILLVVAGCATEPANELDTAYMRPVFNEKIVSTLDDGSQEDNASAYVADENVYAESFVFAGENLRAALVRLAPELNFSRAVIDLPPDFEDLGLFKFDADYKIRSASLYDLGQRLSVLAKAPYKLGLYAATDGNVMSLAVVEPVYKAGSTLSIFNVEPGMLANNAESLATVFGWVAPVETSWQLNVDYTVKFRYPIVVADVLQAYVRLFRRYPVQAQLNQGSREVIFVSRPAPYIQR